MPGGSQNSSSVKEYQNLSTVTSDEMAYDANGNLVKDLDRNIVTITYNLLNLPEYIQFSNGNVIQNTYDAGGQKLRSDYYTYKQSLSEPLSDGEVLEPIYTPTNYDFSGTEYVGNIEYTINKMLGPVMVGKPKRYRDVYTFSRLYNAEGYAENLSSPIYYYYRKDHLGNNREVWMAPVSGSNGSMTVQRTQYYPSGLPWAESLGSSVQKKKFTDKEFIEMHGYDCTDLGARMLYNDGGFIPTPDPLCEKYYSISPYAYCAGNPVNRIDLHGDSVTVLGNGAQSTFQQLQASCANELNLTINNSTIIGTPITNKNLSADSQQLMDALGNTTVKVVITTTDKTTDSNNKLIIGGAFEGNTVSDNKVVANQTINPEVLKTMSDATGKPGADVLHEVTEAYQGGLISQKTGISSPASNQSGSVYEQAHNAATPQSGVVTESAYGLYGMPIPPLPSGGYSFPVLKVEWSVMNTAGQRVIIQTIK